MDAVEFIKEYTRKYGERSGFYGRVAEVVVHETEDWAKNHPRKTRQSEFLKLYPNARIKDGIIDICPRFIDNNFRDHNGNCNISGMQCRECCGKFWLMEVE